MGFKSMASYIKLKKDLDGWLRDHTGGNLDEAVRLIDEDYQNLETQLLTAPLPLELNSEDCLEEALNFSQIDITAPDQTLFLEDFVDLGNDNQQLIELQQKLDQVTQKLQAAEARINWLNEKLSLNHSRNLELKSQVSSLESSKRELEDELQKHKSDLFHGGEIERMYVTGGTYYGHLKDGERHGSGILKGDDTVAVAMWKNGVMHGKCFGIIRDDKTVC